MTAPSVGTHVDAKGFDLELNRAQRAFEERISRELYRAAEDAAADARDTTLFKDRTRKLRGSIGFRGRSLFEVTIEAKAKHAAFVHNGTKAHTITAKDGGLLKFQVNGQWVSTRSVNHPGTTARPFVQLAVDSAEQRLTERLQAVADAAFE